MGTQIAGAIRKEGLRKLSLPERQAMEKELSELSEQLKPGQRDPLARGQGDGTVSRPDKLQDAAALQARKRKLEELLNKDEDLIAKGDNRRATLGQEAKELESRLAKHMLTEREAAYRQGQKPRDYEAAVQKTVYQQRTYIKDLQRWQEIMRQLFPDDPSACDVRKIQPK